ncbi:MAG: acetyl-CoA carboxylase carboxyl transferase subunit alpha, partial [Proteobacteria bacterium]|nr:acetyl-CoA carboxylase carboxyl transferase subunit alpha [Pseudomonadota bacterium]
MNKQTLDFEKPLVEIEQKIEELKKQSEDRNIDLGGEICGMQNKLESMRGQIYGNLSAWQRVQISRHIARPFFLDYVRMAFTDFVELKGDRLFGDDASMPGGLASIDGIRCVVIGQQKGRDMKENLLRNFGSPHPEGYRKALRLMRLAEKFGLPVVA